MAVFSSKAWMPRKSSFSALGGVVQGSQVVPLSVVRRTVPLVPLAHAIHLRGRGSRGDWRWCGSSGSAIGPEQDHKRL